MLFNLLEYLIYFILTGPLLFYLFFRNPYYCLYFFIIWLPIQTFVVSMLAVSGVCSTQLILFLSTLKELAFFLLFVTLLLRRRLLRGKMSRTDYLFLAYTALVFLYVVIPDAVLGAASLVNERILGLRFAIISSGIFLAGRSVPYHAIYVARAIRLLVIVCLLIVLFGLIEFLFIPRDSLMSGFMSYLAVKTNNPDVAFSEPGEMSYMVPFGDLVIKRMMSFFLTPLALAYFLIFPFSLLLAATAAVKKPKGLFIMAPMIVLSIIGTAIFLSITRAVIVAALLMTIVIYFGKNVLKAVMISGVLLLILSVTFLKTVVQQTVNLEDPSSTAHAYAYVVGVQTLLMHPLGIGLGKAGPVAGQFGAMGMYGGTEASVGESLYLSMAVQTGIPSLVIFLIFAGSIALSGKKLSNSTVATLNEKLLGKAIFISTICFLIASIPTEQWLGVQPSAIYWWFAGLSTQLCVKNRV